VDTKTNVPTNTLEELDVGEEIRDQEPGTRRRLLGIATLAAIAVLLYMAFVFSPEDAQQGPPQRIFYIHVPAAWIGFLAFFVVFVASIAFLATDKRRWDDVAAASAEVGVVFTTGVLITGPLWGRPVWGVYWTWDPRLTSFMMLWLIYVSYLVLRGYVVEPARRARYAAVLGIVGFLTSHRLPVGSLVEVRAPLQVVFERDGMPVEMLISLLVGVATFTLTYLYLMSVRLRVGRLGRRAEEEVAA
jgi:heme exporter protein C